MFQAGILFQQLKIHVLVESHHHSATITSHHNLNTCYLYSSTVINFCDNSLLLNTFHEENFMFWGNCKNILIYSRKRNECWSILNLSHRINHTAVVLFSPIRWPNPIRWSHWTRPLKCGAETLGKFKGVSSIVNQARVLNGTTTNAGHLVVQALSRARQ